MVDSQSKHCPNWFGNQYVVYTKKKRGTETMCVRV